MRVCVIAGSCLILFAGVILLGQVSVIAACIIGGLGLVVILGCSTLY